MKTKDTKEILKLAGYYAISYALGGLYQGLGVLKQHVSQLALQKHTEVTGEDLVKQLEELFGNISDKNAN